MNNNNNNMGVDGPKNVKDSNAVDGAVNYTISESDPEFSQLQTAVFKEAPSIYSLDISAERDPTYNDGHSDNVPLGEFLSRPVRIYEGTWTAGYATSNFNVRIDPWTLWQNDARVKAKLSNYAYMSFDLKIRIVLNGTAFQYGRMMVAYAPYGDYYESSWSYSKFRNLTFATVMRWYAYSGASGRVEQAFQHLSTYPCVYLDPSTNQVKEMTLPFVWHNNYISINGDADSTKESLGQLQLLDINPLRIANTSAPTSVNFTIYAWAENVKLNVPTEFTPTSSYSSFSGSKTGSKSSEDEYNDGPVSAPASAVSAAAGALKKVPVIGPFARATEIGAGKLADVARLFGFSAPVMVENPGRCELKQHGRMANVTGEDSSYSLALDPKQEITIDPRTVGVRAEDEMTIKSIITREQFLARCEWQSDVGQFGDKLIFASLVSPNQLHRSGPGSVGQGANHEAIMDHPGGWIANMFQYWKGSVTYRVEVVSTKMHSGRLKLQFDPFIKNGARANSDFLTEDINARYTMILDLQQAQETEFTINWNNRRAWLRTLSNNSRSTFEPYRTDLTSFDLVSAYDEEVHMGIFTVSIVNELVAPIETNGTASATKAPVQVNIYFKCGEDMHFAQPSQDASDWSTYKLEPASQFEPTSAFTSDGASIEMSMVDEHSILENEVDPNNTTVFFGENIVSIRSLIKRYVNIFTGDYNNDSTGTDWEIITRYLPHTPAFVVSGKSRRNSYLSYLMPAFIIARGSTRYKLTYYHKGNHSPASNPPGYYNWVERVGLRTPTDSVGYAVVDGSSASSATLDSLIPHGYNGACFTEATYNPCLEFQLPFYSNTRFFLGCHFANVNSNGKETLLMNPAMTQILAAKNVYTGINAHANVMQQWHAAGDDFSLHFFTGVPMYFFEGT